jgi:hypothetical protein
MDSDADGAGDACDADDDNDGVADLSDNCDRAANADQQDSDADGVGNVCDSDADNDLVPDGSDLCAGTSPGAEVDGDGCSAFQLDADGDGVSDAVDNCATVANTNQIDSDGDTQGDACDPDDDDDGVLDGADACPLAAPLNGLDADADGCSDEVGGLVVLLQGMSIPSQKKAPLLSKLADAQKMLDRGKITPTEGKLREFIVQVQAQRGKAISQADADLLIAYANNIIANI